MVRIALRITIVFKQANKQKKNKKTNSLLKSKLSIFTQTFYYNFDLLFICVCFKRVLLKEAFPRRLGLIKWKYIFTIITERCPNWPFFWAVIIDCECCWLACRSQGQWWLVVMMIIGIIITATESKLCVYRGHNSGGEGYQLSKGGGGEGLWLIDAWWKMMDVGSH